MSAHRRLTNGLIAAVAAALLVALLFFLSRDISDGETSPATVEQPAPSPGPYDRAAQIRAENGLRADLDWVIEVENDPSATRVWFGIALTDDERAFIEARAQEMDIAVQRVLPLVIGDPDYVGLYARRTDGTVVVVDCGSGGRLQRTIDALGDVRAVVQPAQHCLPELEALRDRIGADSDGLRAQGIQVVAIGADIVNSWVELGVYQLTDAQARLLKARYGDIVHVVPAEPFRPLIEGQSE